MESFYLVLLSTGNYSISLFPDFSCVVHILRYSVSIKYSLHKYLHWKSELYLRYSLLQIQLGHPVMRDSRL